MLHLVGEIKGYRREDAKEKKATMDTYWVPADFEKKVASAFDEMIARAGGTPTKISA